MDTRVASGLWVAVAWGIGAVGCGNGGHSCRAPAFEGPQGRCVIECHDAPGAVCDPDSGQVVGYLDAAAEAAMGEGGAEAGADGGPEGGLDAGMTGCMAPRADECGGQCTDLQSDPMHCGACGTACTAPAGASATCSAGQCGFACDPGFDRMGAGCEVSVPRPVSPMSTSTVTSQTPTLRWELASGLDGATVEVCPDRTFQSTQCQTFDASGSSGRPATALTPGVWFWRVRGRVGGAIGTRTGPVWEFFVGARSAGDTSWGSTLDVNGDGVGDLVVGTRGPSGGVPKVYVYLGSPTGPQFASPQEVPAPDASTGLIAPANAGDVNGDGYGDLLVNGGGGALVFQGSADGLIASPLWAAPPGVGGGIGTGDMNGDGYGDLALAVPTADYSGAIGIYAGGRGGPDATPIATLRGSQPNIAFGAGLAAAGDVDGDGLMDLLVGELEGGSYTQGSVMLFRGDRSVISATPAVTIDGSPDTIYFGVAIRGAGDVNADGLSDVVFGDPNTSSGAGTVLVYLGDSQRGLSARAIVIPNPGTATAHFGSQVLGADVNGDGFDDIVAVERAGTHVYLGNAGGIDLSRSILLVDPEPPFPSFGDAIAAGDCDGDGRSDVVVSEPFRASDTGRVIYFRGGPAGSSTSGVILDGSEAGARFGQWLAL